MFGQYFKKYREESALTQEELVARLREAGHRITLARYQRIEKNQSEVCLLDAIAVAKILQICPGRLMGDC